MNKIKINPGDTIMNDGILYVIDEPFDKEFFDDGMENLWGFSNNAEYEIEITDDFVPDVHFPVPEWAQKS
jgi:hypothetical protein